MKTNKTKFKLARWALCMPLAALLAAGGCMVGPNYSPPATTMPAVYGEPIERPTTTASGSPDETTSEIHWWNRFADPEIASLVQRAVAANNSIKVAQARVLQARAAREIAQSLLYPEVDVGASVMRYQTGEAVFATPDLNVQGNLFQLGVDASWVVDAFGGTRRLIQSAQAQEEGANWDRRQVIVVVAAETARAYVELRGAQRQLEVARATLSEQQQTLAVTREKQRNGMASELEIARAKTEVQATAADIPPIQQAIREYIHVLSTLLALEPMALSSELTPSAPIPGAPRELAIGVPSDLLRRRPDIQAAERELARSTAMVGVATAAMFPQMVLGGAAGLASRKTGDLFNGNSSDNPSDYYVAGPFINWTLFDAGRRKAAVKLTEAEVDAAKASYSDTVLRAFSEVESALVAVDRARAQVNELELLSASAREALNIAQNDYRMGLLDQFTVIDAQRQSSRADMLLAQGQIALTADVVSLYEAIGGGWESAEATPATQPTSRQ